MMRHQASKRPARDHRRHPAGDSLVGGQGSERGRDRADRRAALASYYVAGLLLLAAGWLFWLAYQNFAMAQRVAAQTLGAAADVEHVPVGQPVAVNGRIDVQTAVVDDRLALTMYVDSKWVPKNTNVETSHVAPPFSLSVTDGAVPIVNEGYALRNPSVEAPMPERTTRRGLRRGDAVVVVGTAVEGGLAADTVVGGSPAAYGSTLRGEGLVSLLLGLGTLALSLIAGGVGVRLWRRR